MPVHMRGEEYATLDAALGAAESSDVIVVTGTVEIMVGLNAGDSFPFAMPESDAPPPAEQPEPSGRVNFREFL